VSIIKIFTSTLGVITIIFSNNVARRNENVSGSGTSGSGGTNPSTNT
jgi:hypothetical protein